LNIPVSVRAMDLAKPQLQQFSNPILVLLYIVFYVTHCPGVVYISKHDANSHLIFLIDIVGSEVQLGSLGTAATNRPIVPAPGDYDDGEIGGMIGRGNLSTRRKHGSSAALSTTNPTCCPEANPGRRVGKPATNRLSYGTAFLNIFILCVRKMVSRQKHEKAINTVVPRYTSLIRSRSLD
jgi:hypothetical protein